MFYMGLLSKAHFPKVTFLSQAIATFNFAVKCNWNGTKLDVRDTNSIEKVNKSESGNNATLAPVQSPKAAQNGMKLCRRLPVPVDDAIRAGGFKPAPRPGGGVEAAVELRPRPAGSQTQNISNFVADVDEWRWTREQVATAAEAGETRQQAILPPKAPVHSILPILPHK